MKIIYKRNGAIIEGTKDEINKLLEAKRQDKLKPSLKWQRWKRAEVEELVRLCKLGVKPNQMPDILKGRTYEAIKTKITTLRCGDRQLIPTRQTNWSESETKKLIGLYNRGVAMTKMPESIAGRSYGAIKSRLRLLKLGNCLPTRPSFDCSAGASANKED